MAVAGFAGSGGRVAVRPRAPAPKAAATHLAIAPSGPPGWSVAPQRPTQVGTMPHGKSHRPAPA
jgi:hypothetical protein